MTLAQLPAWARELLGSERVARLGLLDDAAAPRVIPVTFALARGAVWSAVDRKPKRTAEPARVRWLRARPQASLCVDRYSEEWSELRWVQVLGRVSVLDAAAGREGLAALMARYPQYADDEPPGPVLRLEVERCLWWRATGAE